MDPDLYYGLEKYLASGKVPRTVSKEVAEEVEKIAGGYQLDNKNQLTKIDKGRQPYGPRLIISRHRMKNLLTQTHNHPLSGHQGGETTYINTARVYYWPGMKADIKELCPNMQDLPAKRTQSRSSTLRTNHQDHPTLPSSWHRCNGTLTCYSLR